MSSLAPLQCLFCNHLNPAGASFCNDCGSQLHLQPCDHCGAINKRTAKYCYKCSAGFSLPPAPAPGPAPDFKAAPARLDTPSDYPVLNDFAVATTHTPEPESMAKQAAGRDSSARWVTAWKSRRTLRIAAVTLLLAAVVMSGDYYSEQSAEFTKTQGVIPFGPSVPGTTVTGTAVTGTATPPPAIAALPAATPPPDATLPKPPTSPARLDKTLSLAAPAAGPVKTVRPALAGEPGVASRQDPPIFNECPDAVAALGFCSSGSKNEGQ